MSFTRFDSQPLRTREQVAREVHAVSLARGLDELATVIALMTISTEVGTGAGAARRWWCPANKRVPATFNYPHDSESDDNRSSGYFQQQPGPRGELWWGTPENMMTLPQAANTFLERLSDDYRNAAGSAIQAGIYAQRVQQSAYPDRYAEKWSEAWDVLRRALQQGATAPTPTGWTGDPVWLPDVLRGEGLVCNVYPGAFERGHGDMGHIWGVMCHHTGSFGETPKGIAQHPTLGLASQLYLSRDGEYTLCGVGIAYHGGAGSGYGITDVNGMLIGIEAANDGGGTPNRPLIHRSTWSDAQYDAYVRGVAAILRKIGRGADRCISHKEWAGAAQGKWDPGQIDMDIFRSDVERQLAGGLSMADAKVIEDKLDGRDGAGKPYDYRLVDLDRVFTVGDGPTKGDPDVEALPSTPSVFDHVTKLARVLTKRKARGEQKLDAAEMLSEILDAVDRIEAKLDER